MAKPQSFIKGGLAADLVYLLGKYLDTNDLGDIVGGSAPIRILPGLVRIPDIAFDSWDKYPNRERAWEGTPDLVPDLVIELLSKENKQGEMKRRRMEFFAVEVQLVWLVDPWKRTVTVFTLCNNRTEYNEDQSVDGGSVLPGLLLSVRVIFSRTPVLPD